MALAHRLFPTPLAVAHELWLLATAGPLLPDLVKTLLRATIAFAIAMVLGTALGILLGRRRWADRLFSGWLLVGLNLPAIVVAIVFYIWLGLTEPALVTAVVITVPQLLPFVLAAARTGLSLIWKIVLVFEVLGSDGGIGYRVAIQFQFFDITGILAYTTAFILVVLAFEYGLLRPLEHRVLAWRPDPA